MTGKLGALYIALAAILWGTTGVSVALSRASGLTYLQVSHLMILSSTLFLTLTLRNGLKVFRPYLIVYGTLAVASFRVLYVTSISLNGVGLTSSLIYMAPLIVTIINSVRCRAYPNLRDLAASTIVFMGAYVATNPTLRLTSLTGFAVGFLLALTYSATLIIPKLFYVRGYSRDEIVVQSTLSATLALTLVVLVLDGVSITIDSLPYVAYGGVVCMGVAVILFYEGLKSVNPVHAGLITTLEPVVSLVVSRVVINEILQPIQYLGAGAIIAVATITTVKSQQ